MTMVYIFASWLGVFCVMALMLSTHARTGVQLDMREKCKHKARRSSTSSRESYVGCCNPLDLLPFANIVLW